MTDHWSELVTPFRPPLLNAIDATQTNCPHLLGTFVHFHDVWDGTPGADVSLPANTRVLVASCSVPAGVTLGIVYVPLTSELVFGDALIDFHAKGIHVHGKLLMGSETCRLRSPMSVTLHGTRQLGLAPQFKGIYAEDGTVEIHGQVSRKLVLGSI
jgi:hypothetical protein